MYKPREDSLMLAEQVKKYAKGFVLDMGTGSGIQAVTAAKKKNVKKVIALDIDKNSIGYCKEHIKNKKIQFFVSDLFSIFKKPLNKKINKKNKSIKKIINKNNIKFDTIIFNPPYLPEDLRVKDLTLDGGKKGYEIIERFLNEVNSNLKQNGIILIIFSSLTNKNKIDEIIKNNLLEFKVLSKKHIFFEDLHVYLIKKSDLLKRLEKKNIKNIKYFSKGKRGILFTGDLEINNKKINLIKLIKKNKKIKIVIKTKRPESKAVGRIQNEIKFLKILNKKNIGPKLLFFSKDYLIYEFIEGNFIIDYFKNNKKNNILKIIKNIFNQLYIMDKLKINKEEMSHPPKHIIINKKNKPILIDFERSHKTKKPSNVTQFCSFLISGYVFNILKNKNIKVNKNKIIKLAKKYKKQINKNNLNKIKNEFQ